MNRQRQTRQHKASTEKNVQQYLSGVYIRRGTDEYHISEDSIKKTRTYALGCGILATAAFCGALTLYTLLHRNIINVINNYVNTPRIVETTAPYSLPTDVYTRTPTPAITATHTITPTATVTPTPTPTYTLIPSSHTPTPSETPTNTQIPTQKPTNTQVLPQPTSTSVPPTRPSAPTPEPTKIVPP